MARGISSAFSSVSSQSSFWILYSMVRLALVRSVTCTLPPVSFHTSQLSTVPNRISTRLCALPCARHIVQNPLDFGCGKVGIRHKAGILFDILCHARLAEQLIHQRCSAAALPHNGVINGRPVAFSHKIVVSRWLVMPMAAISCASTPLWATTSFITPYWLDHISMGLVLHPALLGV